MEADREHDSHKYWIGVVSKAHVLKRIEGGFAQLNHGKNAPLRRLHQGDALVFYSPRLSYPDGAPLQAFTAIGVIKSGDIYQVDTGDGFKPYRIDVRYFQSRETPIKPLIEKLSFIRNQRSWGAAFRFGLLEIPERDFLLIAESLGCKFPGRFTADIPDPDKNPEPVH